MAKVGTHGPKLFQGHEHIFRKGRLTPKCNITFFIIKKIFSWVVLQKLPQLSDTLFSQVLNKLEKIFFMVL